MNSNFSSHHRGHEDSTKEHQGKQRQIGEQSLEEQGQKLELSLRANRGPRRARSDRWGGKRSNLAFRHKLTRYRISQSLKPFLTFVKPSCPLWLLFLAVGTATAQTIRFDFNLPKSRPTEYHLTLTSAGTAIFDEPASDSQDAYHSEFHIDPARTAEVFATAKSLNYFDGDYQYRKHKVADTGEKRFTYEADGKTTTTTFHYSENGPIRQLTDWFQSVAATQEFARKATFDRRFDKLSLDNDVKSFVDEVKAGRATQVQSIRPVLEQIADDPAVLKTVRQRIKELLASASGAA